MITRKQATIKDILEIMTANAELYPDFAQLPKKKQRELARMNIQNGTAQSYFWDGQLMACGGIRMVGLGEAWLACKPTVRNNHKKELLRQTRKELKSAQDQGLWCIWAAPRISENFLQHLGFEQQKTYFYSGKR
jgi:hypothetical protein